MNPKTIVFIYFKINAYILVCFFYSSLGVRKLPQWSLSNSMFNKLIHFRPKEVLHATSSISLMGYIMLINCVRLPGMGHYKGQSMKNKALHIGTQG